ncbi:MAG: hypothetical protein F4144_00950 [Acidimicrobiaceae bacterium]|nr:hypothetical protein [Acidobacteriota bacterium]MYG98015.1 hypothetical protein [Acidimicrobiaceae bacterium]
MSFAMWLTVSVGYIGGMTGQQLTTWTWRRRDKQRRKGERVWRGGTTDSLVFGSMVRRGRLLDRKGWKAFWRSLRQEN